MRSSNFEISGKKVILLAEIGRERMEAMKEQKQGNTKEYRELKAREQQLGEFISILYEDTENPLKHLPYDEPSMVFTTVNYEREIIRIKTEGIQGIDLELRCIECEKDSWYASWLVDLGNRYNIPYFLNDKKDKFFMMIDNPERNTSTEPDKLKEIREVYKLFNIGKTVYRKIITVNE